jgi:hypothetical protein
MGVMAVQGSYYLVLFSSLFLTFKRAVTGLESWKAWERKAGDNWADMDWKQMLVIAFHEFSHAITACCTGGRVESISLDPHEGGVTHMRGGKQFITLPAGYLGSSLIGALLTFCGFNIVASKVASIVLGVCFLLTLWWARKDWLTIVTILLSVGLLVAFWFIEHGEALRFMVVRTPFSPLTP